MTARIIEGDVRERLAELPDESVHCVVTRSPACRCDAGEPVPATVLDPFLGAGTTALVADRLGRNSIGIELSPAYAEMARRRIADDAGMFAELTAE